MYPYYAIVTQVKYFNSNPAQHPDGTGEPDAAGGSQALDLAGVFEDQSSPQEAHS